MIRNICVDEGGGSVNEDLSKKNKHMDIHLFYII